MKTHQTDLACIWAVEMNTIIRPGFHQLIALSAQQYERHTGHCNALSYFKVRQLITGPASVVVPYLYIN